MHVDGKKIDERGRTLSTWKSYAASLDYDAKNLVYAYNCDVFNVAGQHQGIGCFQLIRRAKRQALHQLDGYATDLTDGIKDPNKEYKIGDHPVSDGDAAAKAKRLFGF